MGLRDDLERYREVGEERREDLRAFITHGELGNGTDIQIPIKRIDLPEFSYQKPAMGGVGQGEGGQPDVGQPVGQPQPGDGDGEGDEAGDGEGDHGYYEMNPEEFAEALDDELGLDLEPKGKTVVEEVEGDFTDVARTGPRSTLDVDSLFKQGLKRKLAVDFDEAYAAGVLRVSGVGVDEAFRWARANHLPVSRAWYETRLDALPESERDEYPSIEAYEAVEAPTPVNARIRRDGLGPVPLRRDDERYRYPAVEEVTEKSVVVVNIRDVSGSMGEEKRDLIERVFTPLDWYLTGKYDTAEFVYIAHDVEAWSVEREAFFGIKSGGGTRISSAYELAAAVLDEHYPWSEWNRYVFAAGDGENSHNDSEDRVVPLMEAIDANLHAYVETTPGSMGGRHGERVEDALGDRDNVAVTRVGSADDVVDAIETILSTEQ
ncbi:YeaH/YhbH family protein [Halocalculus aciditolerans]|uniref:YeaH/YhbH family protein n=1 Tax=Halocalculus aciditolerans TaxID=1383812 RepID=A0A830FBV7_9EURY|nr:YeaH/YhbH family protein [Halocalculus aciditolerans]GGL59034.1 hypothetical protein GCM10009039_16600 [Halocalculus aciditolerans]